MPLKHYGDCLHVAINLELKNKLEALAAAQGLPRIALVRQILTQYCNTHEPAKVEVIEIPIRGLSEPTV